MDFIKVMHISMKIKQILKTCDSLCPKYCHQKINIIINTNIHNINRRNSKIYNKNINITILKDKKTKRRRKYTLFPTIKIYQSSLRSIKSLSGLTNLFF